MPYLSEDVSITQVSGYTAAGTSTVVCTTLDMEQYDGVLFAAVLNTAAANNGIKASMGVQSNGSDKSDMAGAETLSDGTGTLVLLDILQPQDRYVTGQVLRGTSTILAGVLAIRYRSHARPVVNAITAVQQLTQLLAPALGAA